jgi:two-component system, chemotaxis family, protein-glutamate methylesterase/glutaminase
MPKRDIVVIGSSAGGVEALRRFCRGLSEDFPASVFIAQHLSPSARSALPQILDKAGPLPAATPEEGETVRPGRIYVAAPDRHMLLKDGRILMRRGPLENRTRPAADALFRSAAVAYGSRVIGVVLTGLLDDGTEGLIAIKKAGGLSVIQDPDDAEWPSMPRMAMERDHVDHCLPLAGIPALLGRLVCETAGPSHPLPADILAEAAISEREFAVMDSRSTTPGSPSPLSCPDCGGVLNQIENKASLRFRCQVGHAFTPDGLAAAQNDELERALGIAVRTHRDRMRLFDNMRREAQARNLTRTAARWQAASSEAEHLARVLENTMASLRKPVTDPLG